MNPYSAARRRGPEAGGGQQSSRGRALGDATLALSQKAKKRFWGE